MKILILTGSIGSGHVSVANALAEAVKKESKGSVSVHVVDFITAFGSLFTRATKKIYMGSLKFSPKIWKLLFSHSSEEEWPIKFLNALSAPFIQKNFLSLLASKKPDIIVSTFPLWDLLLKKTREQYAREHEKNPLLVSVVTDSLSIHRAWTLGNADFFIVANEDTQVSLERYGVAREKIKVMGYPIAECFFAHTSREVFLKNLGLSPKRKTLLLILAGGMNWLKINRLMKSILASYLKGYQLMIIDSARSTKKQHRLRQYDWPCETVVTGWTNEMHAYIQSSDIILTKAGGATIMECINCVKPMIIVDVIPGQEVGNALLVQKYNLGVVLEEDSENINEALSYIREHERLIKQNMEAMRRPHAAADSARFLLSLIETPHG